MTVEEAIEYALEGHRMTESLGTLETFQRNQYFIVMYGTIDTCESRLEE